MRRFRLAVTTTFLMAVPRFAPAHDIPNDVTVHAFVKPSGQRLQLLVRVPLRAMRDIEFPQLQGGYLDVGKLTPKLPDLATLWISNFIRIYEGDNLLPPPRVVATQISLESDKSFASFDEALIHIAGPGLPSSADVVWNQVLFDVAFEYPISSDRSEFSIRPGLERLGARVITVLRFVLPTGTVRIYEFTGDPGLIPMDPRWHQAALRFVELGFFHILDGIDHLLFLFCLVIPFRRFRPLIVVVTAFTIAHSITLISSAFGLAPDALWFPPLIETLIATSIVYMALENIVGGSTIQRRWLMACGFGLVHGFGFSFALREQLQLAGAHLLSSLLAFNVGVELGQLLVLVILIPLLNFGFRYVVAERLGTIIMSALVAHMGWHWMTERFDQLRRFQFDWPTISAGLVTAISWLILIAGALRLLGLIYQFLHRRTRAIVE